MDRSSRGVVKPRASGISRSRPSIPKFQLNTGSSVKNPQERKSNGRSSLRKSVDKIARVSLANSRMTPSKSFTPISNRPYLQLPSSAFSNRQSIETVKSSIGGKSKKCTWPLSEGAFKSRCVENIWNFLKTYQYDQEITPRTLRSPTAKDFASIFTFIYKHFNPLYKPSLHIEDDIPKLLKDFGYPFQMPRSSFLNVASPHTWPSILAMLSWFVDLILLLNGTEIQKFIMSDDNDDEADDTFGQLFNSLVECFKYQDENEWKSIIERFKSNLQENYEVLPEHFHHIQREEQKILAELENLCSLSEDIEQISIERDHLKEDYQKLVKFNKDLDTHIAVKSKENEEQKREIEKIQDIREKKAATIEELKQEKKAQNLSAVEINEFRNQAQHLSVLAEKLEKEQQETNQQIYEKEMAISKMDRVLNGEACDCNLKLANLEIECEELTVSHIEDQIPQWEGSFLPFLKVAKKDCHSRLQEAEKDLAENVQAKEKLEEKVHSAEKEMKKNSAKASMLETDIANIKQKKEKEEKALQDKCDLLDGRIQKEQKNHDFQAMISEVRQRMEDSIAKLEKLKQDYNEERNKVYGRMMQYQEYANDYCLKRQQYVESVNRKLQEESDLYLKDLEQFKSRK